MNGDDVLLKLLHTADWHLGREYPSFTEDARRTLARARLEVLDRVFLEAERNDVHAVLCAGDLFDDPVPKREWWEALATKLSQKSWKRPVLLLPGTHDPLLDDGIWRDEKFRKMLPAFVRIVDQPLLELELTPEAVLYAAPCQSRAGQDDPTASIPERVSGDRRIRVGLVHGSADAQISKTAAVDLGLDYLAIGATHGFRLVTPNTVYPGAPEPTAFDEVDPGHVALVLINRQRRVTIDKRRVAHWSWESTRVTDLSALRALAGRTDLSNRVLRVTVEMQLGAAAYDEAEQLIEVLAGTPARHARAGVLQLNREGLTLDVSNIELDGLPPVLRAAARRLQALAADPNERPAAQRALFHLFRATKESS